MLEFIDRLFNQHKLVRRGLVVWAVTTIGWTTSIMFADISLITNPAAAAYASNTALLAVVLGLYQWSRGRDA